MCLPLEVQSERAHLQLRPAPPPGPPSPSCILNSPVFSIFCSLCLFQEKVLHGPRRISFQFFWCTVLSLVSLLGRISWTRVLNLDHTLDTPGGSKPRSAAGVQPQSQRSHWLGVGSRQHRVTAAQVILMGCEEATTLVFSCPAFSYSSHSMCSSVIIAHY